MCSYLHVVGKVQNYLLRLLGNLLVTEQRVISNMVKDINGTELISNIKRLLSLYSIRRSYCLSFIDFLKQLMFPNLFDSSIVGCSKFVDQIDELSDEPINVPKSPTTSVRGGSIDTLDADTLNADADDSVNRADIVISCICISFTAVTTVAPVTASSAFS